MTQKMGEILDQIELLSANEQHELLEYLTRKRAPRSSPAEVPKWADIMGTAPYPLLGEDAQAWVTRTRREADEHRMRALRGES